MELNLIIGIVLGIVQMIYNALLGLFMFKLGRKVDADDNLRSRVEEQGKTIRDQVDAAVEQKIGALGDAIDRIEKRLELGEKRFQELNNHDHKAELHLKEEVHQLKLYVTKHCATKAGQDDIDKKIAALREDVVRVRAEQGNGGSA